MEIIEYKIIKNNKRHPKLMKSHKYEWNGKDLSTFDNIIDMMNECFKMNKLNEEYAYLLALDNSLNFLGVFEVGHGTTKDISIDYKSIYIFLLLVGADQFIFFHNHPSGTLEISYDDKNFTGDVNMISGIMGIKMIESIIISPNGYTLIYNDQLNEFKKHYKKKGV